MAGLPSELIAELLKPRGRSSKPSTAKSYAIVRREGKLVKVPLKDVTIASFQGKAGTLRRSRKGRTYRLANGRRNYVAPWKDEVVSYRA